MAGASRDSDTQLLDSIEDLSRLSGRQLAERTLRTMERVELHLGELCHRLAVPDLPPGSEMRV